MIAKVTMAVRQFNLVAPLASSPAPRRVDATDMRATDTSGQRDLFPADRDASGAVSPLIGAGPDLRRGDVDSAIGRRTPPTVTTRGRRTSTTATRTTTTRTTSSRSFSSADQIAARHADFSFADLVAAYLDCRRTKRNKPSAQAFEFRQEANLYDLYIELQEGTYRPGRSICFVITRPKPREVWAAPFRDRIVHHLLYNRIADRFYAGFLADSCACIPGRGTLYAAQRLEAKVRSITQNWRRPAFYLKCDLSNFFVSIDKRVLADQLMARIHEPWWRWLADVILWHDPRPDAIMQSSARQMALVPAHKSLLNQVPELGLPIGNLSSQFFANVYLDALDQHVKHRLRARYYIRYVDDFLLLHESPQWLNAALHDLEAFLPRVLGARLNPAKTILQPIARGVDFVGQVIKPWRRELRRRTFNAALQRVAHIDPSAVHTTANSYFGLLRQASASHGDRARLANAARERGHSVNRTLTKTFARGGARK